MSRRLGIEHVFAQQTVQGERETFVRSAQELAGVMKSLRMVKARVRLFVTGGVQVFPQTVLLAGLVLAALLCGHHALILRRVERKAAWQTWAELASASLQLA